MIKKRLQRNETSWRVICENRRVLEDRRVSAEIVECLGQRESTKDRRIIVEPPTGMKKYSRYRLVTSALETNPTNRKRDY